MKKTIIIVCTIVFSLILSGNLLIRKSELEDINAKIYYVDRSIQRLVPLDITFKSKSKESVAQEVIDKLILGEDHNYRILRVIPDIKNSISVEIDKNSAIVNIKKEVVDNLPENKNHQILMLYSIVNSLTSIKGIDTVEFLINGKVEKISIGGIDMREVFIPEYYL